LSLALLIIAALVFLGPFFYRWRASRLASEKASG
jgi:hypothetical protein